MDGAAGHWTSMRTTGWLPREADDRIRPVLRMDWMDWMDGALCGSDGMRTRWLRNVVSDPVWTRMKNLMDNGRLKNFIACDLPVLLFLLLLESLLERIFGPCVLACLICFERLSG